MNTTSVGTAPFAYEATLEQWYHRVLRFPRLGLNQSQIRCRAAGGVGRCGAATFILPLLSDSDALLFMGSLVVGCPELSPPFDQLQGSQSAQCVVEAASVCFISGLGSHLLFGQPIGVLLHQRFQDQPLCLSQPNTPTD